jgi:hypothetical protein
MSPLFRRYLLPAAALLVPVVLLAGAALISRPGTAAGRALNVTRAALDLIERGMTEHEVEALLGAPPGVYRTGEARFVKRTFPSLPGAVVREWETDEALVEVLFLDGRVRDTGYSHNYLLRDRSLWRRLCRWLGWD